MPQKRKCSAVNGLHNRNVFAVRSKGWRSKSRYRLGQALLKDQGTREISASGLLFHLNKAVFMSIPNLPKWRVWF